MVSVKLEAGMANQMFQMAFIYAYAKKHGFEYCVPTFVNNSHISGRGAYIFPGINYSNEYANKLSVFRENSFPNHFNYQEVPAMDNTFFEGFWQSWKYFDEYREEILKAFGFNEIKTQSGACSIHYRATDYKIWSNHHPVISKEYLVQSVLRMRLEGCNKFIVFSDSIDEAEEIIESCLFVPSLSFEYSEGRTEVEDLEYMASCGSQITANSSYSWWAAYINPNPEKVIIHPRIWFGDSMVHDTKDIYLPNSIIL